MSRVKEVGTAAAGKRASVRQRKEASCVAEG